jgi:hypothetical protein
LVAHLFTFAEPSKDGEGDAVRSVFRPRRKGAKKKFINQVCL